MNIPKIKNRKENQSEQNDSKVGRRFFLQQAVAGSIVLASSSSMVAAETYETASPCGSSSFIDALLFQLTWISELQSNILTCFVDDLRIQLSQCQTELLELKKLIGDLEKEICNSQKTAQSKTAAEVIELGQTNIKIIQASISNREVEAYLTTVGIINQQMLSKAQECLGKGEITLTLKASEILRNIIKFINDPAQRISKKIQDVENNHSVKSGDMEKMFGEVRAHIRKASNELVIGETPTDKEKIAVQAIKTAFGEIGKAMLALRNIVDMNIPEKCKVISKFPVPDKAPNSSANPIPIAFTSLPDNLMKISKEDVARVFSVPVKPVDGKINEKGAVASADKIELFDFIIFSLEGIRRGIFNQYNLASNSNNTQISYKPISYKPGNNSSAIDFPSLEKIGELLQNYALEDSDDRRSDVKQRIRGIGGWIPGLSLLIDILSYISDLAFDVRVYLIRKSLRGFGVAPKDNRHPSNYNPSLDKLADGLARLFN